MVITGGFHIGWQLSSGGCDLLDRRLLYNGHRRIWCLCRSTLDRCLGVVWSYHLRWGGQTTRLGGLLVTLRGCLGHSLFLLIRVPKPLLVEDTLQPYDFVDATLRQYTAVLNHPLLQLAPVFDVVRNFCILARKIE